MKAWRPSRGIANTLNNTATMKKHHLSWKENHHNVGIASIDSQHQELIERVNQITDAVAGREPNEVVQEMLEDIIRFAQEHFAFEEGLMAEYGFPDMESHIMEHRRHLQLLNNLSQEGLRASRHDKVALVAAFLADWTDHHIPNADKELGEFLAAKGHG